MTRTVTVGGICIGGGNPVVIQSMLSRPSEDIDGNVEQARALSRAGCQIVRAAAPDVEAAALIKALKKATDMPVVADVHFDWRIALACVDAGADKIRINPGNIGTPQKVREVAKACAAAHVPIRIGVNGGSLEKHILEQYGAPTAQALVDSAVYHAAMLEAEGFFDIIISMKSSHVPTMVQAYRLAAQQLAYPLHLGVTEAGTSRTGLIKSAMGIGALLLDGIGDTIRVSLTADPVEEIYAARDILKAAGHPVEQPEIISCPTCGRTKIDLIALANQVDHALKDCKKAVKVAVMGCAVNGPGEAREADIGIAGGDGEALLFQKGAVIGKYPQEEVLQVLLKKIEEL